MKLIFYFDGPNSSPNTDKIDRLKRAFPDTYAFAIATDPDISLRYLQDQIDSTLLDSKYIHHPDLQVIFIGTSLGGWYAAELADRYKANAIIINPCYCPYTQLKLFDVPDTIRIKYPPIKWLNNAIYYIGKNDQLIDYRPVLDTLYQLNARFIDNADHRFDDDEFDRLINDISKDLLWKKM